MIKAKMRKLSIAVLAFVMVATLAVGITFFSPSKVASAASSTLVIFDGSVDTVMPTGETDAVSGSSYEVVGLSKLQADKTDKTHQVMNTGGNCKNSRYIKFVIAEGYTADIVLSAYTNSDGKTRTTFVSTSLTTDTTTAIGGLIIASADYDTTPVTATLQAGTYYINFDSSVNIYKAILEIKAEAISVTYDSGAGTDAPQGEELATTATETTVAGAPTAPEGKQFAGWSDGTAIYQPESIYKIASGTTSVKFTAVYNTIIDEIVEPTAIVKVFGADLTLDTLGLPTIITGVTVDGEVEIPVVWDTTTLDLTGNNEEIQTVDGTLTAPNGYVFDGVVVDGTVTIDVTLLATAPVITDIAVLNDIEVLALSENVELPKEVEATVNGQIVTLPVTSWDGTYDLTAVGEYVLSADVNAGQYVLPDDMKTTLKVVVYADEVESVEEISVRVTPNSTLTLPETVKVTLQDSLTLETYEKQVEVVWDITAVDLTAVGTYQAVGTVSFDASMDILGQIMNAIAVVNVVNETSVSWTAHDDMTAGDKLGVNWTTVYTDNVLASKNNIVIKAENGCSADGDHAHTLPLIKVAKNTNNAISITIPQGADSVVISVDAAGFSNGKEGNVIIYDAQGVSKASSSISASSTGSGTGPADYVAPTVATATLSDATAGVYYIGASNNNNIYITAIRVTAVVPEIFTVTYNANGGESAPNAVGYEKGNTATIAEGATPQKGYEFVEWNTASDGTGVSYAVGAQLTVDQNVELFAIYKKVITSVEFNSKPDVVMVKADFDTAVETATVSEVLGLPATVKGFLIDDTQLDLTIDWTLGLQAFETASYAVGSYNIEGAILSSEYNFDSAVIQTVSVKVTILAEKIAIVSIEPQTAEVELGQTAVLPTTVKASLLDGTQVTLPVDFTSANVDFSTVGTKSYEGVVTYDQNAMSLAVDVKAVYEVTVYNYTIIGFEALGAVNAFTNNAVPALPSKVIASYVDRQGVTQQTELEISSWNTDGVTISVAGTYIAEGTVAFTDLYTQGEASATVSVDVIVSDYVQASTARSTNFVDYNLSSPGTLRGFTISGTVAPDSIANLQGQKIKQGSISFTLTSPATVTMSIGLAKDIGLTFSNGTTSEPIGTVGSAVVVTKHLDAGTYSIGSTSNKASFSIGYITIEDGASELFVATAERNVLPGCVNKKTVDGVEYTFYGYVTKTSTEIIPVGSTVEPGEYYALYIAGASLRKSAGIQVVSADKQLRFGSSIKMLNASALFNAVRANGILTFTNGLSLNGSAVDTAVEKVSLNGDIANVYQTITVDKFTNVYTASLTASIGSTILADNETYSASAKQVAEALVADVKPVAEGVYKFQTADGYARFNTAEREMIATYIVDDADSVDPVVPDPTDPVVPDPTDPVVPDPTDPVVDPTDPVVDPTDPVVDPTDPVVDPIV